MRYDDGHESPDLIDRRGDSGPRQAGGGLFGLLLHLVASRFGIGGVVVLFAGYFGLQALGVLDGGGGSAGRSPAPAGADRQRSFVAFVLDDVQDTWTRRYPGPGSYQRAKLVLFRRSTDTACGLGQSATGPFYCPADRRAYLDLEFFDTLERRLGAKGDFARAYVIAHEIGHHVQNLMGTSDRVHRAPRRQQQGAEGLSVRLELQADCYAGVWAHATRQRGLLERGDLEEALEAAAAIGDDTLQRQSKGRVRPESFTHGTSAQRARWFQRGFEQGDPQACDTFSARL